MNQRGRAAAVVVALALIGAAGLARANGRYPAAGQIAVDPGNPRHIVARTTFGLLQTFDAGAHWTWICEQAISPAGFEDPELVVRADGRLLLGLPDGVAVGDSSGCGWTRAAPLAGQNAIDLVQNAGTPAIAYAAAAVTVSGAFAAQISVSHDGVSWTATAPPRADTYPLTIESAPSRPQRLYLGAENADLDAGFVDVSDDGGVTWTRNPSPGGVDGVYVSGVDPNDADRVYLRSDFPGGALFVSDDAARTWSMVAAGPGPLTGFALAPDGGQVAIGGSDGVQLLSRLPNDAGGGYAVVGRSAVPVGCLTWTPAGLYVCGDDRTAGFTIGLSTDGGATFRPLLRLAQLAPAACPGDSAAGPCAAAWCATAGSIRRRVCRGRGHRCTRGRGGRPWPRRGFGLRVRGCAGCRPQRGHNPCAVRPRAGAPASARRQKAGHADELPTVRRRAVVDLVDRLFAPPGARRAQEEGR